MSSIKMKRQLEYIFAEKLPERILHVELWFNEQSGNFFIVFSNDQGHNLISVKITETIAYCLGKELNLLIKK